ncbi:Conserved_hypothetical protein [Hexamita inflata]|uniref:Uncharacterized protein n=1 Tax=Hexamita inflata TaxID=28002 RepID=A0AA86Q8S8_9EUKA|nr:Conserved hypothetical protein [Hexamita inflata]
MRSPNSRLQYKQANIDESTIRVEDIQSGQYDESLQDALGYLQQPQAMLKVKGFDLLLVGGHQDAFDDSEMADMIYDEILQIFNLTDAPQLIQSLCQGLATVCSCVSMQSVSNYCALLMQRLYLTLKQAHSLAYPESLCINTLSILHACDYFIKRLCSQPETAFTRVQETEQVSDAFQLLLNLSIQIFGQYGQEFVSTVNGQISEPSRHISLLIQVYVQMSVFLDIILSHPFTNLQVVQRFDVRTAQQLVRGLSNNQPLVSQLVRLFSGAVFQVIEDAEYYLQLIRADSISLIEQVLVSRVFASRIFQILLDNSIVSKYIDLAIACVSQITDERVFDDVSLIHQLCVHVCKPRSQLDPFLRAAYSNFIQRIEDLRFSAFGPVLGQKLINSLFENKIFDFVLGVGGNARYSVIQQALCRILCSRFVFVAVAHSKLSQILMKQLMNQILDLMQQNKLRSGCYQLKAFVNLILCQKEPEMFMRQFQEWNGIVRLYTAKKRALRVTNGDVIVYAVLQKCQKLFEEWYGTEGQVFDGGRLRQYLEIQGDISQDKPFLAQMIQSEEVNALMDEMGV